LEAEPTYCVSDTIVANILPTLMSIFPRGLLWLAPSTKGWNKGTRTAMNPCGSFTDPTVHEANHRGGILALLIIIAWLNDVMFVLEQPATSWLLKSDPIRAFLTYIGKDSTIVDYTTAAYDSSTSVRIKLWGTWSSGSTLGRRISGGKSFAATWDRTEAFGLAVKKVVVAMSDCLKLICGQGALGISTGSQN
jgi:hypothetical protein